MLAEYVHGHGLDLLALLAYRRQAVVVAEVETVHIE
jgi:hypothetical protein